MEKWKEWPARTKYIVEVSNMGRVRYRDRLAPIRIVTQAKSPTSKYMRQRINVASMGWVWLHRIVAETFHGPALPNQVVRHLNGDATDNRASNVCWGTYLENIEDMKAHGTRKGEGHARAKLTTQNVTDIRSQETEGCTVGDLAAYYDVSETTVRDVITHRTWAHVQ